MKYSVILLLLITVYTAAAQEDSVTSFYTKEWKKTEEGPEAFYYRKSIEKNGLWHARSYYYKNGALRSTGTYKFRDSIRHGDFVYYYGNGKKEQEGKYINDREEGIWNGWHENGNKWYVGQYREGYRVNSYDLWRKDGEIQEKLNYLDNIEVCKASEKTDSTGKKIRIEGKYKGTCLYYYPNGKLASKEEWGDKPLTVAYWDSTGRPMVPEKDSLGEYVFEVMPKFDGDPMKFLTKEVKYPKKSMQRGEAGRVILKFIVGKDGDVTDVSIWQSSGFTLIDEEAKRVVLLMSGKWTPGRQHNLPVRVYYTIPITFKLQN